MHRWRRRTLLVGLVALAVVLVPQPSAAQTGGDAFIDWWNDTVVGPFWDAIPPARTPAEGMLEGAAIAGSAVSVADALAVGGVDGLALIYKGYVVYKLKQDVDDMQNALANGDVPQVLHDVIDGAVRIGLGQAFDADPTVEENIFHLAAEVAVDADIDAIEEVINDADRYHQYDDSQPDGWSLESYDETLSSQCDCTPVDPICLEPQADASEG